MGDAFSVPFILSWCHLLLVAKGVGIGETFFTFFNFTASRRRHDL